MNELDKIPATGAHESPIDLRTIKHESMTTMGGVPLIQGGYDYLPTEILMQAKEGICTSISLTQNAQKYIGRKLSAEFLYLLQKRQDGNWTEGSSIFSALKVGTNIGLLPAELFTEVTEVDRNLPYAQYIAKLQAIPEAIIQQLILQCSDYKLTGYASVDVTDPQAIAKAISDSKAGILCRYDVGAEWYTSKDGRISWNPVDINPLRHPNPITSGHAITAAKYDYSVNLMLTHPNTWSPAWNRQGLGDTNWSNYKPTEAWVPYYSLTELQLMELKAKLQVQLTTLQKLVQLWITLKQKMGIKV